MTIEVPKKKTAEGIYPHTYKDGSTAWRIKYDSKPDPLSGKRVQRSEVFSGTLSAAKRRRAELISESESSPINDNTRVATWANQWLDKKRIDVNAKTFERYEQLVNQHIVPNIGERKLMDLKASDIHDLHSRLRDEDYRKETRKKGYEKKQGKLSEHTIRHVHGLLSQLFQAAVAEEKMLRNLCHVVKAPKSKKNSEHGPNGIIHALEKVELTNLLKKIKAHTSWGKNIFPITAFAAGTGMRRGEILALRWTDINFSKNLVSVEQSIEEIGQKVTFKSTKNKTSRRTIGLDAGLMDFLRTHRGNLESSAKEWTGEELPKTALLFPQALLSEPHVLENYSKPMRPHYVSHAFRKAMIDIGFAGFRFHDLRHTHATLLLTDGVPVNAVAARLGHAKATMTLDVYGHVLMRAEEQSVQVAGRMLDEVF